MQVYYRVRRQTDCPCPEEFRPNGMTKLQALEISLTLVGIRRFIKAMTFLHNRNNNRPGKVELRSIGIYNPD